MTNQDSTEKDAKIVSDSREVATSKTDAATAKELTDEQLAAVVGGIIGNHIGTSVEKKM